MAEEDVRISLSPPFLLPYRKQVLMVCSIIFDSTASSKREEGYDQESRYWNVRAWVWICDLVEEIWQDGGEILRSVLRAGWNILLVWKVQVWVAVLVGGVAFVFAYLHD